MSLHGRRPVTVERIINDQSQFSDHLYNSLMMNKDRSQVNEKILNLTLEIIFLLTGEDFIVVKKQRDHVTDEALGPAESITEPSPNSMIQERDDDQRSLGLTIKVLDHDNVEPDVMKRNERDSELNYNDRLDLPEETSHPDVWTDNSSNITIPERYPIQAYSQDCTEEDNRTTQDYQIGPVYAHFPQQCKEEEIPTDISTDESKNRNTSKRRPIHPYPQDSTEEEIRITQDYQIGPVSSLFPQQCKEEEIPIDISTDESKNRNTQERRPIHPYPQCSTEEEIRITQDYQDPSDAFHLPKKQCTFFPPNPTVDQLVFDEWKNLDKKSTLSRKFAKLYTFSEVALAQWAHPPKVDAPISRISKSTAVSGADASVLRDWTDRKLQAFIKAIFATSDTSLPPSFTTAWVNMAIAV
ncbi:uncharacterized protein WCC33_000083 [Rhinophrynus dorsalis]